MNHNRKLQSTQIEIYIVSMFEIRPIRRPKRLAFVYFISPLVIKGKGPHIPPHMAIGQSTRHSSVSVSVSASVTNESNQTTQCPFNTNTYSKSFKPSVFARLLHIHMIRLIVVIVGLVELPAPRTEIFKVER